jgi:hypothetical protein
MDLSSTVAIAAYRFLTVTLHRIIVAAPLSSPRCRLAFAHKDLQPAER